MYIYPGYSCGRRETHSSVVSLVPCILCYVRHWSYMEALVNNIICIHNVGVWRVHAFTVGIMRVHTVSVVHT